jgi:hypothetical protein
MYGGVEISFDGVLSFRLSPLYPEIEPVTRSVKYGWNPVIRPTGLA